MLDRGAASAAGDGNRAVIAAGCASGLNPIDREKHAGRGTCYKRHPCNMRREPRMTDSTDAGRNPVFGFLAWVVTVALAAGLAAIAAADAVALYAGLVKPEWAPPSSIFAPVWAVLYLLMAIAAWLVWRSRGFGGAPVALTLFLVQLAENVLWSWLFFGWRQGLLALVDIVALLALIAATVVAFWRVRPLAGALLLPYLVWTAYVAVLSYWVWMLNPDLLA